MITNVIHVIGNCNDYIFNVTDIHAVAIYRDTKIVWHVPYNVAPRMSEFFMRGAKVNRRTGYGLEVPCVYHLHGANIYVDKMKDLVESLLADGHYNQHNNFVQW